MLPDSPACKSSWLKRQYKAVILSDCNISASFPTARQANMCRTDLVPHILYLYRISFCLSAGFGLTGSNRRVFGALHDFLADHLRQLLLYWLGRPFAGRRAYKVGHFAYLAFRCLFSISCLGIAVPLSEIHGCFYRMNSGLSAIPKYQKQQRTAEWPISSTGIPPPRGSRAALLIVCDASPPEYGYTPGL